MTARLRVTMNDQPRLLMWAAPRMGVGPEKRLPADSVAIGVLESATDEIEAVIVFNAFYGDYASLHLASNGRKRWLSRKVLACVFGFAFDHLRLKRLNFLVSVRNIPVQVLALKVGLRIEGVARCAAQDGADGVFFGMLADDCKWLKRPQQGAGHGQEQRTGA